MFLKHGADFTTSSLDSVIPGMGLGRSICRKIYW